MPTTGVSKGVITEGGQSVWRLPAKLDPEDLTAELSGLFSMEMEAEERRCLTWFDTFDWRLYRHHLFLCHDGTNWQLFGPGTAKTVVSRSSGQAGEAVRPAGLPKGRLRKILLPIVDKRTLLALFAEDLVQNISRLLSPDISVPPLLKITEHRFSATGKVCRTVSVECAPGDAGVCGQVLDFFHRRGISSKTDITELFTLGVQSRGRFPLDYSSKFSIELQPDMSALQAMQAVFRQLLATLRCNEKGVVQNLDTEFLHDFRVAVRRTRTGLSQVRKVLPKEVNKEFRDAFAWLGSITGPTRDLDVYLLYEDNYRARLPESLHTGLHKYFAQIRVRRDVEWQKLVHHLQSEKYRRIVESWQLWLESDESVNGGKKASLPVAELSGKIILSRFKRILKKGSRLSMSSPAGELHRLRIQCKKLRYILEFFASLYPEEDIGTVIRQLRRLQSNLGKFNDLSVQLDILHRSLAELRPESREDVDMAAALGGLLTTLQEEHRQVRSSFSKYFQQFSRPENSRKYLTLFGSR